MRHACMLLGAALVSSALAGPALANETAKPELGKKVDTFALQDFRGKAHSLDDLKDAKLVVVAFLGVECPLCKLDATAGRTGQAVCR